MRKNITWAVVLSLVVVFVSFSCGGGGSSGGGGGVTIDNSKLSGVFTVSIIDASGVSPATDYGTITFDGAGNGSFTSLVSVSSGTFKYTVTVADNTITIDNTTIGTLNKAGNFFSAIDTSSGAKNMVIGIKQASLFTDTTITFIGGVFEYDPLLIPASTVSNVMFTTHASGPGVLLAYNVISASTGTTDYTIASNGTFTIHPASPDTYGAISADKNIFMFSQVGSKQEMACALKYPSTGMTKASLNGTYRAYEFWDANVSGAHDFGVTRYKLTFDGNGNGTGTYEQDSVGYSGTFSFTYTMTSNGVFLIDGGVVTGFALQDGSMIVFGDFDPSGDDYISAAVGMKL
jgi:hypothetical protein